jgi:GMP synthase-like glutamine amidotransferase
VDTATLVAENTLILVVENDATDDPRRLGGWLRDAGLTLEVVRPYAGDALPATLDGYAALIVLGGDQNAYHGPDGLPGAPWFPALESLLRRAVRADRPTLGVCLGGQLLAQALGGQVGPAVAGPEIGPRLVARRDAADRDPLFAPLPMLPDVLQWHHDEVSELPAGAVLLAASTDYPHQAFRAGRRAWGLQFHIECDTEMIADWASTNGPLLADLGLDPVELLERSDAVMDDLAEVWRPFAERFAALARGELDGGGEAARRELPLLGHDRRA